MDILHIYKDYPPVRGGIENHIELAAAGLAARGHRVTVLVTNPDGCRTRIADENGVRVIRAGRLATVASTPLSLALPRQLARRRADVVHLHFPYPVGETSQWLLRRGRATVLTYHSDIVRQAGILRFYRPLMQQVLRAVAAIIIGSPPMAHSADLASHRTKLRLIPYGIPLARFRAAPPAALTAKLRSHIAACLPDRGERPQTQPEEGPLILFVGQLRYYKGLDHLIAALPRIPAHLAIAGTGPMEPDWRELARRTGVADRIAWLGEVADADLAALYHLADLFVLPASHRSEAFGLVQVEAMAAGLPVVSTELHTGTSYVNQDGVTGLVVPPRDPAALAGAITSLLSDPARRRAMGVAAQARAAAEFDATAMIDRLEVLYRDVIAFSPLLR